MAAITRTWVLYRMAIIWAVLISLVSLGTCITASLQNAEWSLLNSQARFLLVIMVFVNWGNSMAGLITNTAKKIESGQLPFDASSGNTDFLKKTIQTTAVQQTTTETKKD